MTAGRRSRMRRAVTLLPLVLSGCLTVPEGTPPEPELPDHYAAQGPIVQTESAQGRMQRFHPVLHSREDWWVLFGSPELDALVAEALGGNLDLAHANRRLASTRESLTAQTRSSRWPSIDLGAQAARQRDLSLPLPGMPTTSLYNTFVGQVQASYTFDLFGAIRNENEALAHRIGEQAFQLEAARHAVAANTVAAAVRLAALAEQHQTMQELIDLLQADARDAERQYRLGAVPRESVLEAQAHAASIASQIPDVQDDIARTRHALAVLMGRRPDQAPGVPRLQSFVLPTDVPTALPSALVQERPDIRAADAAVRAAAADARVATARLFPQLSISASMGRAGYDWSTALSGAGAIWNAAASLAQPLFRAGALQAQRRAAMQDYEAAIALYRQTVLSAFAEMADALSALDNDARALERAEAAQDDTRTLLDAARQRVDLGALPRRAVRARAQQLAQARLDVIGYQAQRLASTARLLHAMAPVRQPD